MSCSSGFGSCACYGVPFPFPPDKPNPNDEWDKKYYTGEVGHGAFRIHWRSDFLHYVLHDTQIPQYPRDITYDANVVKPAEIKSPSVAAHNYVTFGTTDFFPELDVPLSEKVPLNGYLKGGGQNFYAETIFLPAWVWGENGVLGIPNAITDLRVEVEFVPPFDPNKALIGAFKVFLPLWEKGGQQVNTFYEETGVINYDGEFEPKFYEPIQAIFGHLAPTLMTYFISVGQSFDVYVRVSYRAI